MGKVLTSSWKAEVAGSSACLIIVLNVNIEKNYEYDSTKKMSAKTFSIEISSVGQVKCVPA